MGNFVFKGCVNDDKNKSFIATAHYEDDFQFEGTIGWSQGLQEHGKRNLKSVSEIKKEQDKKEGEKNNII